MRTGIDRKLDDLLRLALQSDNVDLRDAAVSYIALSEYEFALEFLADYVLTEKIDWLRSYALTVFNHLKKKHSEKHFRITKTLQSDEIVDLPKLKE